CAELAVGDHPPAVRPRTSARTHQQRTHSVTSARWPEQRTVMPNPEPAYVHARSAAATRRAGARLSAVGPQNAPHTFGPAGVVPSPDGARGDIVYLGLDESKAAADGTNLSPIAGELQAYAKELASQAETQAVIALAP